MLDRWKQWILPYYLRWIYYPRARPVLPPHYAAGWTFPNYPLDPHHLRAHIPSAGQPAFLFLPMSDWHARMLRSQHLACQLSGMGHPSFYLNPLLGREYRSPFAVEPGSKFGLLGPSLAELHVHLPVEPVYHHRMLTARENTRLVKALSALAGGAYPGVVQVLSLPTWLDAALELRTRFGWPIVYDCQDYLAGFVRTSADIVQAESRLLSAADHIFVVSRTLEQLAVERFPHIAGKTTLLPNAVDFERFSSVQNVPRPHEAPLTIGYYGALEDWFYCEIIEALSTQLPDSKIILGGRVEHPEVERLRALPNVELRGEIPYGHLPAFLSEFDVALIAFRPNPLTRAASPMKMYEYLSAGLPVVSTRLPEVEPYEGLVYLADSPVEFVSQVQRAARENGPQRQQLRREAMRRHTWQSRAGQLAELGQALLR
jgi:glycosyltransferase involved in cell wall biosynthesis